MPLTDVKIRQAKAGNKPTKLTEGNGLYLLVNPSGSRLWRYKYRIVGKEISSRSASTQLSTSKTRSARRCPRTRQEGTPPVPCATGSAVRMHQRRQSNFSSSQERVAEKKRKTWTERHFGEILRMLETDAYPYIGNRPMRSVTAHDVLALMRRVEERGAPSVAIKLRPSVANVSQYAVITLRADADPASVLRGSVLKPPTENARPLSRDEIKALFRQLPTYKSRADEPRLRSIADDAISENDQALPGAMGRNRPGDCRMEVPPEKIKSRRLHIVPLPKQALGLLRELQETYGNRGYVLPILHSNRTRAHMSRATINRAIGQSTTWFRITLNR
ncbi:integrase arm-type DNA-binding domain-containing protein [Burkholderia ambifaria]|nr:integrase arm-type DNA-binding domain-containing protein [Burkholderia ambifaria]